MELSIDQKILELQSKCRTAKNGMTAMRMILNIMNLLKINVEIIDQVLGFCDRTKTVWITRYNQNSVDGLKDLPRTGRKSLLIESQKEEIKDFVNASIKKENPNKIICAKQIYEKIKNNFRVNYSSSGLYKLLKRLKLGKVIPRPIHEKNDPEKMRQWLTELPTNVKKIREINPEKKIKFYFQDETRYGQKTIYTGIWALKGSNVEFKNQDGFLNSWIYGAVNPENGDRYGFILPDLNSKNMNIFLENFSKTITRDEHVIMILDGSGAHTSKDLKVYKNISFIFLPPYSPQLNPIERLWKWIKSNYLSFKKFASIDEIIDAGVDSWLKLTKEIVMSVCQCDYLKNF